MQKKYSCFFFFPNALPPFLPSQNFPPSNFLFPVKGKGVVLKAAVKKRQHGVWGKLRSCRRERCAVRVEKANAAMPVPFAFSVLLNRHYCPALSVTPTTKTRHIHLF